MGCWSIWIHLMLCILASSGTTETSTARGRGKGSKELFTDPFSLMASTTSPVPRETMRPVGLQVFGVPVPVCDVSCRGKCTMVAYEGQETCQCDQSCVLYGDCCLDYFAYCYDDHTKTPEEPSDRPTEGAMGTENGTESGPTDEVDGIRTDDFGGHPDVLQRKIELRLLSAVGNDSQAFGECQVLPTVPHGNAKSLTVVKTCPSELPSELTGHIGLCSPSSSRKTLQQYVMVLHKSPTCLYSNLHCALCHGLDLETDDVESIPPEFQCGELADAAERILQTEGYDKFSSFLIENCEPAYDLASVPTERLKCGQLRDSCEAPSGDDSIALCLAYTHMVVDPETWEVYKNPHCATCNGVAGLECYDPNTADPPMANRPIIGPPPSLPSFSLLFDFSGNVKGVRYKERSLCPKGTFLRLTDDTCVTETCGQGHIMLDNVCSRLNISIPRALKEPDVRSVFVLMGDLSEEATMGTMLTALFDDRFALRAIRVDPNCSLITSPHSMWYTHLDLLTSLQNMPTCLVVEVENPESLSMSFFKISETFVHSLVAHGLYEGYTLLFFNHWPYSQSCNCCGVGKQRTGEMDLVEVSDKALAIFSNGTGARFSLAEVPTMMEWQPNFLLPFEKWPLNVVSVYCEPEVISCDRILVGPENYKFVDNAVTLNQYPQTVIAPQMYATVAGEESIVVCSDALPNNTLVVDDSNIVEGILSVVGISLSMIGLAFTVLTYSLFHVLRTVPGVGIMNLSVALFVAQLLFEVAPLASGHDAVCIGLGALEHYCWLVAFLWMNVLAYDICCTFVDMSAHSQTTRSLRFRMFCVHAWGLPAILVVTSLVLNKYLSAEFEYIDTDICWIKGGSPILYVFGAPVGIIILVNITLFARTAYALRDAMKIARRAKSEKESFARYAVYIKLSSLMGFTWIFGFVAGLTEVDALSYLFIATNSVQGLYICLSFALSGRVRRLYKNACGWRESADRSSRSSQMSVSRMSTCSTTAGISEHRM